MKPLSFMKYFKSNFRKSAAITAALVLSVFLIIVFRMVTFSVTEATRLADVALFADMSSVMPGEVGKLDEGVIEQIKGMSAVDRIVPVLGRHTDYNHFFGTSDAFVFTLRNADIGYVLKKKGLKLAEGRMPKPGENEILLERKLANNKGKKLGDFIGMEVDPSEKLPGKYRIVGLLDGNCIVGFIPMDDSQASQLLNLMVYPKDGQLSEMNSELAGLPAKKVNKWTIREANDDYIGNARTLNTIFEISAFAVIFIMSFASGNSSYAQYFARRYEFGVLQSIGYTKSQILLRAAREIGFFNLFGFIGGALFSIAAGMVLEVAFFEPHGYAFRLIQPEGVLIALTVPVCTALFGLIPAGWLLSRISPMTVIEKFE